jgi:hypothetical protein
MQVLSFDSTDTWLTDVTLSGDAWVARALNPMRSARVHAQGVVPVLPLCSAATDNTVPLCTTRFLPWFAFGNFVRDSVTHRNSVALHTHCHTNGSFRLFAVRQNDVTDAAVNW